MSQNATGLATLRTKARSLQRNLFVFDRSTTHTPNIREVRPAIIAIKLATDENRKSIAHGFERNAD